MKASDTAPKIKLEYYSDQFAKKLFRQFPHWKQYIGYDARGEPDLREYFLDLRVPPVNPKVSEPLHIFTRPEDVTVSWVGGNHAHFDDWRKKFLPPDAPDYHENALMFIKQIVADKIVFGNYYKDGKSGGGFYCNADGDILQRWLDTKHGKIVLRSWLGGHDREIEE